MNDPILAQIKRHLEAARGTWPEISAKTGVPYSTISNIVQEKVADPRIGSLQPLLDYFGVVAATPANQERTA